MSTENNEEPKIKITEKKVDSSWKDEIRKEREAARLAAEAKAAEAKAEAKPAPKSATPDAASDMELEAEDVADADGAPGDAVPAKPAAGGDPKKAADKADPASKLFMSFVASLVQQTLMQLGQMENPFTNRRELDLEGAKSTIDILAVLTLKTKGNLSPQESKILNDSVRDLQMYYVELSTEVSRRMQEQLKNAPPPGAGGPGRPGRK